MRQLMAGLMAPGQPKKTYGEKQVLAKVNETSNEISTSRSHHEDRIKPSPTPAVAADANLKIEELSNSNISIKDEIKPKAREPRWQPDQPTKSEYSLSSQSIIPEENFQSLQGLMSEKERANQEIEKIKRNKSLTPLDKQRAIRSVNSLTRTIDDLIFREKDKISEHLES